MMTDAGGNVAESYTYDVYGKPYVMTSGGTDGNWLTEDISTFSQSATGYAQSAIGNPYLFTARRWHPDVSGYYYRFRDYDPALGRFLQPDPAGYIDTLNLYAYCGNNPLNWIDPWGLFRFGNRALNSTGGRIVWYCNMGTRASRPQGSKRATRTVAFPMMYQSRDSESKLHQIGLGDTFCLQI